MSARDQLLHNPDARAIARIKSFALNVKVELDVQCERATNAQAAEDLREAQKHLRLALLLAETGILGKD